jgi:hypothetical protein
MLAACATSEGGTEAMAPQRTLEGIRATPLFGGPLLLGRKIAAIRENFDE